MSEIDIEWDARSQRFRFKDTKRFASAQQVRSLLNTAIASRRSIVRELGDQLESGAIDLPAWTLAMGRELKMLHSWSWLLGVGGYPQMRDRDIARLSQKLVKEFEFLHGFGRDISEGMSSAMFRSRVELYLDNTTSSYHESRELSHDFQGYKWERRHRTLSESCRQCIEYEGRGWQKLGTLPTPGSQCDCRARCGCYKEFSMSKPDGASASLSHSFRGNLLEVKFGWL
jgi:hypothetical protein